MKSKMGYLKKLRKKTKRQITLRNLIWISFTVASVTAVLLMGSAFFSMFSSSSIRENAKTRALMLKQVNSNLASYLKNMRILSDTLDDRIRGNGREGEELTDQLQLLYEANRDNIKNIALFTEDGELVSAAPDSQVKEKAVPQEQEWFLKTAAYGETPHFYPPHVQNLFKNESHPFEWVISMSRTVRFTDGQDAGRGVLLVDLKYSGFTRLLEDVSIGEKAHIFIADADGNLIYHPIRQMMSPEEQKGICRIALTKKEGTHIEKGSETTVKRVEYTGWYLVGQNITEGFSLTGEKGNLLALAIFLLFSTILVLLNSFVSRTVARPFTRLEKMVGEIEKGNLEPGNNISGVYEVDHLGKTIQQMGCQLSKLMKDIVQEHEAKRKSELDSLQAQINPHFLYNTLDVIVWMIRNEQKDGASRAVMALSRFFRISLSRGKNIISVKDEMEHVKNYLIIQKMRYKNRFTYTLEIEPGAEGLATIKLVLQPLVENAIYHGMEFMDGDGEIHIRAWRDAENEELCLSVRDNGLGMTQEKVKELQDGNVKPKAQGSGIGVSNVNQRIQLYFGKTYGMCIRSEPDEGTEIVLHMPAREYAQIGER